MARSLSRRSGRFFLGSSLVVCSSSFQSLVCTQNKQLNHIEKKKSHFPPYFSLFNCLMYSSVYSPVQVCAPHNPDGRYRRPQLERSPWHGLPAEQSSYTPGKAWLSSQTGASGPCSNIKKTLALAPFLLYLFSYILNSLLEVCSHYDSL